MWFVVLNCRYGNIINCQAMMFLMKISGYQQSVVPEPEKCCLESAFACPLTVYIMI